MLSLQELDDTLPPKVKLNTLRQASKCYVIKRNFGPARILIEQAIDLATTVFGPSHLKFSDTHLDYGFFLLNFDSITESVKAYKVRTFYSLFLG